MDSQILDQVTTTILGVLNEQEQMHSLGMQPDRQVGAEVMFFGNGRLVIEPTLSLGGKELEFEKDAVDLKQIEEALNAGSTTFRERFKASTRIGGTTKVMRIAEVAQNVTEVAK